MCNALRATAVATFVQNSPAVISPKGLKIFERYLTIWVALCMAAGLTLGEGICGTSKTQPSC